jgi:hypothetical protein
MMIASYEGENGKTKKAELSGRISPLDDTIKKSSVHLITFSKYYELCKLVSAVMMLNSQ